MQGWMSDRVRRNRNREDPVSNATNRRAAVTRHYMHAAMRLRYRYGLEMSIEEYESLTSQVVTRRDVFGYRCDELGNVDAWVMFKGKLVCAAMKAGTSVITTFMPAPPHVDQPKAEAPEDVAKLQAEVLALRKSLSASDKRFSELATATPSGALMREVELSKRQMREFRRDCMLVRERVADRNIAGATALLADMAHRSKDWDPAEAASTTPP